MNEDVTLKGTNSGGCFALAKYHKNSLLSPAPAIRSMSSCPQPFLGLPEVVFCPLPWEFIPSKPMSQLPVSWAGASAGSHSACLILASGFPSYFTFH